MSRTQKVCTQPGCPVLQPCPTHTPKPWALSNRRATLPPHWERIRRAVFKRDRYKCVDCAHHDRTGRTLECDHIGDRDDHSLPNLATRCAPCHAERTKRQAADGRRAARR